MILQVLIFVKLFVDNNLTLSYYRIKYLDFQEWW